MLSTMNTEPWNTFSSPHYVLNNKYMCFEQSFKDKDSKRNIFFSKKMWKGMKDVDC